VTAPRWLPAAAVTVFAAALAWLNRGERVALDIGIATFYRAPITVVLFLAFLAGMLSMLLLSLRQDRRLRDELRARGIVDLPAGTTAPAAAPAAADDWSRPQEPGAAEWPRHTEPPPPVRTDPAPADERTDIYPRYDEDPAA
jgi:uncharacterized integral membrane protein